MTIYKAPNNRSQALFDYADRINNQIILYGTNQTFPVDKGIFFLEYLETDGATTVTIKDGNDVQMTDAISEFNQEVVPLRCDYGITITGDVVIAKGFFVERVFEA